MGDFVMVLVLWCWLEGSSAAVLWGLQGLGECLWLLKTRWGKCCRGAMSRGGSRSLE